MRHWFIISKIQATPTWGLICNGIKHDPVCSDFLGYRYQEPYTLGRFSQTGRGNSLTVYLVPDMFYYVIWQLGLPLLIYKESGIPLFVAGGSILWAIVMGVGLPFLLEKINFRLKL